MRTESTLETCDRPPAVFERDPRIEALEKEMLGWKQIECPLKHRFAPGVYLREITMPAGAHIIGQLHRTEHFNIVLRGRADVYIDGQIYQIVGPCTFTSKPGVRKLLRIIEEMVWQTVHPTDETDLGALEALLIEKSEAYKQHEIDEAMRRISLEP